MNSIDIFFILGAAFLGSIGHCIGMCGGIVVAYSSSKIDPKSSWMAQTIEHLTYNLGRVTTYTFLGAVFGLLGQVVAFTPTTKGVLFLITGILMIMAGLSLLGNIKFLNSADFSISRHSWYRDAFKKLVSDRSLSSFYLLGLLNGIIPCGLVYSFAFFAASTASPLCGAVTMATFGLATIPALFFLGTATRFLQRGSLRGTMMKLAAMLVILYGLFTLYKAYQFIVHPQQIQQEIDEMKNSGGTMRCGIGKCG